MTDNGSEYRDPGRDGVKRALDQLLGIARGLLADRKLGDSEISYLREWLDGHYAAASTFPGSVIHRRVREVLADGIITAEERAYLVQTLEQLVDGSLVDTEDGVELSELWFDEPGVISFDRARFSLAGNFVYGPVDSCRTAIEKRGGDVAGEVSERTQYLVVGGLGLDEWRSGRLGAQLETAVRLRERGAGLKIIPEDSWAAQL